MNRVLIVLPNWVGDTLFATPFLRALRRAHPSAFIVTLGWPQCRHVLLHNPDLNELIDYEEQASHRGLGGMWRLSRTLRTRRFDTAFILRKSLSRSILLMCTGIPRRIGFANAKSGWCLTRRVAPPREVMHKALSYAPLLEAASAGALESHYAYVVDAQERQAAQALVREQGIDGRPVIILHPGANWWHKRWAPERFAELGDRLMAQRGAKVLLTGAAEDVELAQAIAQRMRQRPVVLAGRTTLRQLAACVSEAQLLISNDTGVLHLAAAVDTPLIGLYGPTSPQLTGPLGDAGLLRVIHHADSCPRIPCYQPDHPAHPGMGRISVDEVYDAAVASLGARG